MVDRKQKEKQEGTMNNFQRHTPRDQLFQPGPPSKSFRTSQKIVPPVRNKTFNT
jgi:hypothetical protein